MSIPTFFAYLSFREVADAKNEAYNCKPKSLAPNLMEDVFRVSETTDESFVV